LKLRSEGTEVPSPIDSSLARRFLTIPFFFLDYPIIRYQKKSLSKKIVIYNVFAHCFITCLHKGVNTGVLGNGCAQTAPAQLLFNFFPHKPAAEISKSGNL